ncbi:MAG: PorV/PorQ family protein [bacterium]|nr:PorV/PorQ family protein [bacterium]
MAYLLLILTTLLAFSPSAMAADDTTSATFLKIGAGARAAGMGDAFCGLADDAYAMHWNPAGLGFIKGSRFGATHLDWLTGISQEQVGFVQQIGAKTGFGINISHLSANDFERTNKNGIFGTFDAANTLLGLSLGRQIGNKFSLGLNMKYVHLSMDDIETAAYGVDTGMLWQVSRRLRLGLNVQNIGSEVKFIENSYPLPFNIKAGLNYSLGGLNLNIDANKAQGLETNVHAGCEYLLAHTLALRAGIRSEVTSDKHGKSSEMTTGISAGMGLQLGGFQLDYAYVPYGSLDVTHRVSLSVRRMPHPPISSKLPEPGTETLPEVTIQEQAEAETRTTVGSATQEQVKQVKPGTRTTLGSATLSAEVKKPEQEIKEKLEQKDGRIGRIILPSFDIRFDTGRAMINAKLYKQLDALAEFMNCYPQIRIRIEGHTDNRAIDTPVFHSNQELSEARAKTIYWYLVQKGIPSERIEIKGYADTKPIVSNDTPDGQAKNRRVEVVIIEQGRQDR